MHDVATRTKNTSVRSGSGEGSSGQKQPPVTDARPDSMQLKEMKEMMHGTRAMEQQRAFTEALGYPVNQTGMPDTLKAGLEGMSGIDLSDVKVHYNSAMPEQLQAHAYAQGNDIYLGPGQEKHLPHEGWHVVQQKQGRVKATAAMEGMAVNDSPSLEQEADVFGKKAVHYSANNADKLIGIKNPPVAQMVKKGRLVLGSAATLFSLGLVWLSPGFRKYMRDAVRDVAATDLIKDDDAKLKAIDVEYLMELDILPPTLSQAELNRCTDRGISDTLLFVDVIKTRYGQENLNEYYDVIMKTLETLQNQFITRKMIIEVLAMYEKKYKVEPEHSETFDTSVGGIARSREGAYRWEKSHDDFFNWINDKSQQELRPGAGVNCWEAALAALIDAGKLTKKEVADIYVKLDEPLKNPDNQEPVWYKTTGLEELFIKRVVGTIKPKKKRKVLIRQDDILIYNKEGEALYHVMIALGNEGNDGYQALQVMSLWKQNAGSFAIKTLDEIVRLGPTDTINICRF